MIPRLLLLFAFIIISFKFFHIIHLQTFKSELCDDGFYTGGIERVVSRGESLRKPVAKKSYNSRRPAINKPAVSHNSSIKSNSSISYSSYEAYKKVNIH